MVFALAAVLGVVFVVRWRNEPRRLSNGFWAVLAIGFGLLAGAALGGPVAIPFGFALLALCLAAALSMPVAAVFLIANGLVMLRRERPTAGNLVGLAAGLGLVGIMVGSVLLFLTGSPVATLAAIWLGLVASYFAFVFVCFATFCLLYARRRRRRPVQAVVILGSGVRDGHIPPLLAARLTRAVELRAEHQAAGWPLPLLVPSGGQGPDEIEPEGESMARWLRDHDVPSEAILVEPRARNTEENLRFSAELVAERFAELPAAEEAVSTTDPVPQVPPAPVPPAPVPSARAFAVVTNDYHAFRAALQARRLGLDAEAVGARTAAYFVPSAYLREFIAILRENRWLHLIMVAAITLGIGLLAWQVGVQ